MKSFNLLQESNLPFYIGISVAIYFASFNLISNCICLRIFVLLFSGELHVPLDVCGAVVKRELDFWEIDEFEIKACCWRHYRSYIDNQRILNDFNQSLQSERYNVNYDDLKGWRKLQMQVWLILDHPRTSRPAMVSEYTYEHLTLK